MIFDTVFEGIVSILIGVVNAFPALNLAILPTVPQPVGDFADGFKSGFGGFIVAALLWRVIPIASLK